MFIRFFRSSFAIQYLVIVLIASIWWLPSLLNPFDFVSTFVNAGLLYSPMANWLSGIPLVAVLLTTTLVVLLSYYFNEILSTNLLIARNGFSGALSWLLLFGFSPGISGFTPMVPAALFVLAALHMLFLIYDNREAVFYVFNGGFFIAMAGLYYPAAFVLFVWFILGLIIALQFDWRNFGAALAGLITPVYFTWSWYFLTDNLKEFYQAFSFTLGLPELLFFEQLHYLDWLVMFLLLLLLLNAISFVWNGQSDRNLGLRKKISIVNGLFFFSCFLFFWKPAQLHALILIPVAVYLAYDLAFSHKLRLRSVLLVGLVLAISFNHYYQFIADGLKTIF